MKAFGCQVSQQQQERHAAMALVIGDEPINRLQLEVQPGRVPWDSAKMKAEIYEGSPDHPQSRLSIGNYETVYIVTQDDSPYVGSLGVFLHKEYQIFGQEHTPQDESETNNVFFIFGGWQTWRLKYYFVPSEPWPTSSVNGEEVKHRIFAKHFVNPILDRINVLKYIHSGDEDGERLDTLAYPPFWLAITATAKDHAFQTPDAAKQQLKFEAAEAELALALKEGREYVPIDFKHRLTAAIDAGYVPLMTFANDDDFFLVRESPENLWRDMLKKGKAFIFDDPP